MPTSDAGTSNKADSLGEVPICPGCALMSHIGPAGICTECWNRRERRAGGGPLRIVTRTGGCYHETPLCPAVRGSQWKHIRDEEIMYADLAGDVDKCSRCHSFRVYGFDHYRGRDKTVVGHA